MTRSFTPEALEIPARAHRPDPAANDPQTLAQVLSEIAETASETLELQDVFGRVAASIRRVIPFDQMGVIRILEGEWAVKHATTIDCPDPASACSKPCPLTAWSPRLRPRPGLISRIDNAEVELDPTFPGDADILAGGVRSALWAPFKTGDAFTGGVWLSATTVHAFTNEHQHSLQPIAALLGSAVEHWRIWDADRRRRDRLDHLERLLGTLAESLDVREIFERISVTVRDILPHELLTLSELNHGASSLRIVAFAGESDGPAPDGELALTPGETARQSLDFEILHDIPAEVKPVSERDRLILRTGMRSLLRVPVWLGGVVRGSLGFFSHAVSVYSREDVEIARRLSDRVALMLSHQKLSEEARIAAEARERAERLAATVETLTRELEARERTRVVGVSTPWKDVLKNIGRVAASETTVLITGESGTGKEIVSRLVHEGSSRSARPFVAINCAAIPEQLLESELFGHEKGAFTGAVAVKIGRIEQAAGGTLFLDEIAEMSPQVQAKFLRVLQEKEFQRLGGTRTLRADARIVAATNRDLATAISRQEFREDLYYRLNVFQIHVAPLRERPDDILPLAEVFLDELGRKTGRPAAGISRDAREWFFAYAWPGNVRELRNAIERAILLCDGGLITREHLPAAVRPGVAGPDGSPGNGLVLDTVEKNLIEKALIQARGNKTRAARLLGLTRSQLYSRLEKHGLIR